MMRGASVACLLVACAATPPPPPEPMPPPVVDTSDDGPERPEPETLPESEPPRAPPAPPVTIVPGEPQWFEAHDPVEDESHRARLGFGIFEEGAHHEATVLGGSRVDGEEANFGRVWNLETSPELPVLWPHPDWRVSILDLHERRIAVHRGTARAQGSGRLLVARKGQPVELPGGMRYVLDGHGHKKVMAGGPSSPLLVAHRYLDAEDGEWPGDDVSLHDDDMRWAWRDLVFEVKEVEYGAAMTLEVRERVFVPAVPVAGEE